MFYAVSFSFKSYTHFSANMRGVTLMSHKGKIFLQREMLSLSQVGCAFSMLFTHFGPQGGKYLQKLHVERGIRMTRLRKYSSKVPTSTGNKSDQVIPKYGIKPLTSLHNKSHPSRCSTSYRNNLHETGSNGTTTTPILDYQLFQNERLNGLACISDQTLN
jgi:hypothetical protein